MTLQTTTGDRLDFAPEQVIVAGYTGRDEAAVRRHIDELAEFGVAPPPEVPMFYPMPVDLLTAEAALTDDAGLGSGEVEPVLLRCAGRWYLAVGSDHTDRELERSSVQDAKAACPKPIGAVVAPLPDDLTAADLDNVAATMSVDGMPYQKGDLAGLRPFADIWTRAVAGGHVATDGDIAVFGGTLPLLAGEFVPGRRWEMSLVLPTGETLSHEYRIDRSERSS